MNTADKWMQRMREAFPLNPAVQRRLARDRVWKWQHSEETSTKYYHDKVRLLRQAFGYDISEFFLVSEIKEGLPPEFRQHIRLPDKGSLASLRNELVEWEPVWKEVEARRATATSAAARASSVVPRVSAASLERSASAPALPKQVGPPSSSPSIPPAQGLSASYDRSRVTPAANGEPRKYRRPDNDKIMVLDRPCNRCNGDHFNFEHRHLVPQVRILEASEDDYPELDEVDLDSHENGMADDSAMWNAHAQDTLQGSPDDTGTVLRMDKGKGKDRVVDGDVSRSSSASPSTSQRSGSASPKYNLQLHDSEIQHAHDRPSSVHFASRGIFHVQRSMPINESHRPLDHDTHRYGNVVKLPTVAGTGTGTGFRHHIPLTTHVRLNGTDSKALPTLLDTGASLSVIDEGLLRRLGGSPQGEPMDVYGLGNARTLGWVTIPVFIQAVDCLGTHVHLEFLQDFHVIPAFAPGLCLGQDFIAKQDLHISPVRGRARLGKYTFEVTERVQGPYAKDLPLVLEEDVTLEPGFQRFVTVGAGAMMPGVDYAVYPRLAVTPDETVRIAGPAGIMRHRCRRMMVLGNYGSAVTTLRRGTIVADATAARVGDLDVVSGQVFSLSAPPPASPPVDSDESAPEPDDVDVAMPLDAFEGTEPPGSAKDLPGVDPRSPDSGAALRSAPSELWPAPRSAKLL
ncbi:hypothetical protein CF328_g8324, partial [Tilletia controversa]